MSQKLISKMLSGKVVYSDKTRPEYTVRGSDQMPEDKIEKITLLVSSECSIQDIYKELLWDVIDGSFDFCSNGTEISSKMILSSN